MRKITRPFGLTLMEVLISGVLISTVLIGLANLFIAGKRYILHSRARMTGGELGKAFLDPLAYAVSQDTWALTTGSLYIGTRYCGGSPAQPGCPSATTRSLHGLVYTSTYYIYVPTTGAELRGAQVTLYWVETAP